MNIAVFGGSFDPWTSAHQEISEKLSEKYDIVLVVPTTIRYYKNSSSMYSFEERLKTVRKNTFSIKNIQVLELERNVPDSWRYIDTLREIIKIYGEKNYYFTAIGSDSLQNFTTWACWGDILKLSKLIVFNRPKYTENFPDIEYEYLDMENYQSSTKIRNEINSVKRNPLS